MAYHGISLVFGDAQKKVLAGCACKIAIFFHLPLPFAIEKNARKF